MLRGSIKMAGKDTKSGWFESDTKIAEMDPASSGEAARLRVVMETLKRELTHLKNEQLMAIDRKFNRRSIRASEVHMESIGGKREDDYNNSNQHTTILMNIMNVSPSISRLTSTLSKGFS